MRKRHKKSVVAKLTSTMTADDYQAIIFMIMGLVLATHWIIFLK